MNSTSPINSVNLQTYAEAVRYYATVILRRWPLIIGLGLFAGILTFVFRSFSHATYTSRADVAMLVVRTKYDSGDNTALTTTDAVVPNYLDDSRWTGLVTIANSPSLLREVKDVMYANLPAGHDIERRDFQLDMNAGQSGDILRLSVTYTDKNIAAEAANKWADLFVGYANQSYISSGQTKESSQYLVDDALAQYVANQTAFEEFEQGNEINEIERQMELLKALMVQYDKQKQDVLMLVNLGQTSSSSSVPLTEINATINQLSSFVNQNVLRKGTEINVLNHQLGALDVLHSELSALANQIENGVQIDAIDAGTNLSLMIARANSQLSKIKTSDNSNNSVMVDEDTGKVSITNSGSTTESPNLSLSIDVSQLTNNDGLTATSVAAMLDSVKKNRIEVNAALDEAITAWLDEAVTAERAFDYDEALLKQADTLLNAPTLIMPDDPSLQETALFKNARAAEEKHRALRIQREQLAVQRELLSQKRISAREQYNLLRDKSNEISALQAVGSTQARRVPLAAVPANIPNSRGRASSAITSAIAISSLSALIVLLFDGWLYADGDNMSRETTPRWSPGKRTPKRESAATD